MRMRIAAVPALDGVAARREHELNMSTTDSTPKEGSAAPVERSRAPSEDSRAACYGSAAPPHPGARRPVRLPSRRVTAAIAALTLGIGVAIGAAIGPAPPASFAGTELPGLLGTLLGRAATAPSQPPASAAGAEAGNASTEEGVVRRARHRRKHARATSSVPAASEPEAGSPSSGSSPKTTSEAALKPVTSVWLIELSGESFSQALAQPAAAPYIDSQLVLMGTLETAWTALDGSAFASDAALAGLHAPAGSPSPIVNQIIQPPCPEGAAGAQCQAGTPGQLTAADAFVKQAVTLVSGNALYRAHGLIVVTFASVMQATAAELPEGTASSTLTTQPPAGALLISPFIRAGARSASAFDSTSPTRSLKALLGK